VAHDSSDDDDQDSQNEDDMTEAQKAAKKLMAFYSWTCPNCNYAYAENKLPKYFCYCSRWEEPDYNPMVMPHSCGEYCDKPKNKTCKHGNCDVICHPGACPPCNISVSVKCYCEKQTKYVPC